MRRRPTWNSRWTSTGTEWWWECNDIRTAVTESALNHGRVMNKKQLTHLEKRLMEERARVMKELGYYDESFNATLQSSDGDLSSYSFHMADQGTDAMEREKQFLFASQEGRYLWHVNEALRRLYGSPDKFGHCQQCGQEINFERLDALPHARLCITCKEKEEDGKRR
jgi:DnaK suppressor protein